MIENLWYALPLIVTVSLVYAGTRHEEMGDVLVHSLRTMRWIVSFMLIIGLILWIISSWVL